MLARVARGMSRLPGTSEGEAWVGVHWRVGSTTACHVYGGTDQLVRITFRAELDDETDWDEVAELLTDSYCLQAPAHLVERVDRPTG